MAKRFKGKKRRFLIIKVLILLLIIYMSFSLIYNTLYKYYLHKLSTKEFISDMIKTKETKLDKYLTPEYILKYTFDINKEQEIPVNKDITNTNTDIYIYNTHDTEKYYDSYLENYNIVPDVKTVSYILKDYLEEKNISVYVEKRNTSDILKENDWSYQKSYDASRIMVSEAINNNYKLIIDIHRDSTTKDKTTLEYNGKNYAKVLFVIGTEFDGFEKNYLVADTISNNLNNLIPDISKGIIKKSGTLVNGVYNEDLSSNLVLIEIGGQYNEIEELNNTLAILAQSISSYLKEGNT